MTKKVLGSENKQYGFYGTINDYNSTKETELKWAEAFTTLFELSGKQPEEIRTYLDSRSGRKLADCCIDTKEDVKNVILKEYFKWVEDDLFDTPNPILYNIDKTLFGTLVFDEIRKSKSVILYTGKKAKRDTIYAKATNESGKIYITSIEFLTPVEE